MEYTPKFSAPWQHHRPCLLLLSQVWALQHMWVGQVLRDAPSKTRKWMKPGSVSLQPALTATGRSQSAEKSPLSLLLHWQDLNPQSSSLHSIYDKYYHVTIQLLKKLKDIRFWPDVLSEIWATRITCQELKDIYTAFHKQKDYTKQANKQKRPPEKVLIKLCQEWKLCLISMREKEKCLGKSSILYYK